MNVMGCPLASKQGSPWTVMTDDDPIICEQDRTCQREYVRAQAGDDGIEWQDPRGKEEGGNR
jgi:hypothetical protein